MSKNWSSLVLFLRVLIDTTGSHGQKRKQELKGRSTFDGGEHITK